MKMDKKII